MDRDLLFVRLCAAKLATFKLLRSAEIGMPDLSPGMRSLYNAVSDLWALRSYQLQQQRRERCPAKQLCIWCNAAFNAGALDTTDPYCSSQCAAMAEADR